MCREEWKGKGCCSWGKDVPRMDVYEGAEKRCMHDTIDVVVPAIMHFMFNPIKTTFSAFSLTVVKPKTKAGEGGGGREK